MPSFQTKLTAGSTRKKRRFRRKKKTESQMEATDRRKRARLTIPEGKSDYGEDRISELPDEILVLILSRLTLGEAVLTSVLSKRWKYVWTCISTLNFDGNENNMSCDFPPPGETDFNRFLRVQPEQYIQWVYGVLAQHRSPNVEEFRLCYDLDEAYSSHIDDWIGFALSNKVHRIEFNLSDSMCLCCGHKCYTLHRRVLGLSAIGFKSLKTLLLKAVNADDEAIEYILSNCPLLEQLSLHLNFTLRNLKVVGQSMMLRHLEVDTCPWIESIEICNTNLVSFTYSGNANNGPKIVLKNAPQLVEISIKPNLGGLWDARAMFSMLSYCFSQLKILQWGVYHVTQESLGAYMWPKLENLKQFVLVVDRWSKESLLGYLIMIKNWPNLERFVLQLSFNEIHEHDKERKATRANLREAARFCHPNLKVVRIAGYCNTCDFELLKQIIENSITLEKIIIDIHDPESESASDKFRGVLEKIRVEQQLRKQVSSGVELVML